VAAAVGAAELARRDDDGVVLADPHADARVVGQRRTFGADVLALERAAVRGALAQLVVRAAELATEADVAATILQVAELHVGAIGDRLPARQQIVALLEITGGGVAALAADLAWIGTTARVGVALGPTTSKPWARAAVASWRSSVANTGLSRSTLARATQSPDAGHLEGQPDSRIAQLRPELPQRAGKRKPGPLLPAQSVYACSRAL
jgi:hypothetical protein